MKLNKLLLIVAILFSPIFLTGCNKSNGVETKAYVVAIGLDKRRKQHV